MSIMQQDDKLRNGEWYYIQEDGKACGPCTEKQLRGLYYEKGIHKHTLVWREGMPEWKAYHMCIGRLAELGAALDKLTGLQGAGNLTSRSFFSQVFKRHTPQEAREAIRGVISDTPIYLDDTWPTPWLYSRYLFWGMLIALLFLCSVPLVGTVGMVGLVPIVALIVPLAVLILFTELNVRRDLPLRQTFIKSLAGVALVALPISVCLESSFQAMYWAAPIEEPAKLLTALAVAQLAKIRMNRILQGLMLGCAIGAAFAFLETCTYIIQSYNEGGLSSLISTALMRGIKEPFAHTLWTAICVGAFCLVQSEREQRRGRATNPIVDWDTLLTWRFLRIAIIPIILHFMHNGIIDCIMQTEGISQGIALIAVPFCMILICIVAWMVALRLVQAGLRQARGQAAEQPLPHSSSASFNYLTAFRLSAYGELNRRGYWLALLTLFISGYGMFQLTHAMEAHRHIHAVLVLATVIFCIWGVLLFRSITVRRLHDIGLNGWWALCVPPLDSFFFLPSIILGCIRSRTTPAAESKCAPAEQAAIWLPEPPEPPRIAEPGLHEGGIFCPTCSGYGLTAHNDTCPTCGGTAILPLHPHKYNASIEPTSLLTSLTIQFRGRMRRSTYFFILTLTAAAIILLYNIQDDIGMLTGMLTFTVIYLSLVFISATVRRLHDIGFSGWWTLLLLPANLILFLTPSGILCFVDTHPGTNKWGPCPKSLP